MAVDLGNRAEVCRQAGLPTRALNNWLAGTDRPSLLSLLRLLNVLDYWPSEAFLGDREPILPIGVAVSRPGRQGQLQRKTVRIGTAALLKALRSGDPPPLGTLAESMGCRGPG